MTRISVVVPTWRGGRIAVAAVRSALDQTYGEIEVTVVDDASPDDTVRLLRDIDDPRLSVHACTRNLGPAGNWNRGLAASTGEWVKLLCQDDLLHPDALAIQLAEATDSDVLVSSPRNVIGPAGEVLLRGRGLAAERSLSRRAVAERMLRAGTNVLGEPSAVLMRGNLARELKFDARWSYAIDMAMWMRMLEYGTVSSTVQTTASFRVSLDSWSTALSRAQTTETETFAREVLAPAAGGRLTMADRLRIRRSTIGRRTVYGLLRVQRWLAR